MHTRMLGGMKGRGLAAPCCSINRTERISFWQGETNPHLLGLRDRGDDDVIEDRSRMRVYAGADLAAAVGIVDDA